MNVRTHSTRGDLRRVGRAALGQVQDLRRLGGRHGAALRLATCLLRGRRALFPRVVQRLLVGRRERAEERHGGLRQHAHEWSQARRHPYCGPAMRHLALARQAASVSLQRRDRAMRREGVAPTNVDVPRCSATSSRPSNRLRSMRDRLDKTWRITH